MNIGALAHGRSGTPSPFAVAATTQAFGVYFGQAASNIGFRLRGFEVLRSPAAEPATYAMALAGLACGGSLVFRRRKRA